MESLELKGISYKVSIQKKINFHIIISFKR
jgi:hypothetical protein